jgi:2-hydroxychromene-2-carboxylate isomerase
MPLIAVKRGMGELILISDRIADRSRPSCGPAAFFFAPGCPISYLASERIERALGEIEWTPVLALPGSDAASGPQDELRALEALAAAEREAQALRLPLVRPENLLADTRSLTRAAVYAGEYGVGARFALVAARLIFCGGAAADDPDVIAETAEVVGLPIDEALWAADDARRDLSLEATARGLHSRGVRATPALRIGTRWFDGLAAIPGTSTYTAA